VTSLGFEENEFDQCIYLKVSGSKFIFLVLYVDDMLLASNDLGMLHETKKMLTRSFDMKDLGEASFVLGIEIHRDRSNPGNDHWVAAKKVMRYLQRTKDYMLVYRRVDSLEIVGYTDSNRPGCLDDLLSTSGYIFMMAGGAISWRSKKQEDAASSTMLAEFVACFHASSQAVWLRNLVMRLRVVDSVARPLRIFCDNSAAVFFTKNNKRSNGSKHLDLKYLSVRGFVKKGYIIVEYISTDSMLADPLTKGLKPIDFKRHVENMGIVSSFDVLG
jgi:hypothetical protein